MMEPSTNSARTSAMTGFAARRAGQTRRPAKPLRSSPAGWMPSQSRPCSQCKTGLLIRSQAPDCRSCASVAWTTRPPATCELPAALRLEPSPMDGPSSGSLSLTSRLERAFAEQVPGLPVQTCDLLLLAAADERASIPELLAAASVLSGGKVSLTALDQAKKLAWPASSTGLFSPPPADSFGDIPGRGRRAPAASARGARCRDHR